MGEADDLKIAVKSTKKLCIAVKKADAIFVGQYIFTGTEITSVLLEIMIRDGDEAAAQEDEMVRNEPEVEKKMELEPEFEKQKEKKQLQGERDTETARGERLKSEAAEA
ncbi:unnamed protein product [Brassica rapa subsp. trilocularis]